MHEELRLTKIGKIIRKYGLDELPQFYNILKGDMSLIGPRPNPIRTGVPEWSIRCTVRPGLIGRAQILEKSLGVPLDTATILENDLTHITRPNLKEDVKLLWQTARLMMLGRIDAPNRIRTQLRTSQSSSLQSNP